MIGSLKGFVTHIYLDSILLDVSSVGYQIYMPQREISALSQGQEIFLLIHTFVREDNISLFGFLHAEDKKMFLELNKVSGIGSKTALNILGIMNAEEIKNSILYEDSKNFTRVSGIGNKAAQRIINELKDKIGKMPKDDNVVSIANTSAITKNNSPQQNLFYDAVSALENLGYQRSNIIDIVKDICKDESDLANVISKSLKLLSS